MKLWIEVKWILKLSRKMKLKLEYISEVYNLELLEIVNYYQKRCDGPVFNTLDNVPETLVIKALDEAHYIKDEFSECIMAEDLKISELKHTEKI